MSAEALCVEPIDSDRNERISGSPIARDARHSLSIAHGRDIDS
jgi:hypothetical protein